MEILSGLEAIPDPRIRTPIVTWGVFDGVHLGHRQVLDAALAWAREEGVSSVAATFDRHPREVLTGVKMPLLSPLGERLRLIGERGIDFCLVLNFTVEFSKTPAERYIRDVVAGRLRARGVVLGPDSRFGRDRGGDVGVLEQLGVAVRNCEPERVRGVHVSSSLIRDAIHSGRLEDAAFLLGRRPSVIGTVVRGDRRGSTIGFPTANLELHHAVRPPTGVYSAEALLEGRIWRAVVNIGTRPTFNAEGGEVLEVHLLEFPGRDLYGRVLEVRFHEKIRDEKKFSGPEELKKQIEADIEVAKRA